MALWRNPQRSPMVWAPAGCLPSLATAVAIVAAASHVRRRLSRQCCRQRRLWALL